MPLAIPRPIRIVLAVTAALAAFSACGLQIGTGIEARDTWTRSYKVKAGATLEVREINGLVHVEAGDGDTIEVIATRITKAPTEEAAKAMLKDFTIDETASADRVALDGTPRGLTFSFSRSRHIDYNITVPRSAGVTIKTTNGEVSVQGIAGLLQVEAVNGEITASDLTNGAQVSSINGPIRLQFARLGESGVRVKTTNGEITVTIPSATKANISGRVVNGDIRTDNLTVQTTEKTSRRLEGTIGGGGPEIRLETINGEVRLVGR